jgi:hypothetical protein
MLKAISSYILIVTVAFFLFQSYIVLNSFPAMYGMYTTIPSRIEIIGQFWTFFWFLSEFFVEIGLIIRYIGVCLFGVFSWLLFRKKQFSLSILGKAILFEGVYFLFFIPFILNLFTRPESVYPVESLTIYRLTAISYTLQTILVFPSFIVFFAKIRDPTSEKPVLFKWGAIAIGSYTFALWVKHFFFNLYALPIDFGNPILFVGLLNSTLTMLVAAIIMLVAFNSVIRYKTMNFSSRGVGIALIAVGAYFIIYILVALLNPGYMVFLPLTELWALSFFILGVSILKQRIH